MAEYVPYQDGEREIVRQVFPDAPDGCLDCPGLTRAARALLLSDRFRGIIATMPENPENPLYNPDLVAPIIQSGMEQIEEISSELHEADNEFILNAAQNLWERCYPGVILIDESTRRNGIFRETVRTLSCGSADPLRAFISEGKLQAPNLSKTFLPPEPLRQSDLPG